MWTHAARVDAEEVAIEREVVDGAACQAVHDGGDVLRIDVGRCVPSLSDLLLFENEAAPGVPLGDVEETSNYIAAMSHGLQRIESGQLPLYLSLYFKQNRDAYYDHLQRVRTEGAWEEWLEFFLEGVIAVASSATLTARRIQELVENDRGAVHEFGRGAASALRVHELAGRRIGLTASGTAGQLGLSVPTVNAALARLEQAGILREVTGRKRGRLFVYDAYLTLLQAEQ